MTSKQKNILFYSLLFLIFLLGAWIRLWHLDTAPPGVWYDEAFNGIDAIKTFSTENYQIFYPENYGREGLYINLIAFGYKFFGINIFSLRLISALFGILGLIGFYLLTRLLKISRWNSLLVTFLLTTSFWHLNFSRIAFRGILVPTILTWAIYFFFLGLNYRLKKRPVESITYLFFLLSGFLLGLGLHTYIAFRLAPFVFIVLVIGLLITQKKFLAHYWFKALIFIFGALLSAGPLLIYFYLNTNQFVGRADAVSIFNSPLGFWPALGKSLSFHLGSLFFAGDPNPRHNYQIMPLLPPAWSLLFGLGFFFSLQEIFTGLKQRLHQKKLVLKDHHYFLFSLLAQGWFWFLLIPGVLSIEGIPHALRIIGILPAIFLLIALTLEKITLLFQKIKNSPHRKFKKNRLTILRFSLIGLFVVLFLVGLSQLNIYFNLWSRDIKTALAFEKKETDLGKLVNQLPIKKHPIILFNTETKLAKASEFSGWPKIKQYSFYSPAEGLANSYCQNSLLIFYNQNTWLKEQIQKKCPNLKEDTVSASEKSYPFLILQ